MSFAHSKSVYDIMPRNDVSGCGEKFTSYFEIQPVSFSPGFLQLLFVEPDIRMFSHNPGTVIGKGVFHFCRQDWASWLGNI